MGRGGGGGGGGGGRGAPKEPTNLLTQIGMSSGLDGPALTGNAEDDALAAMQGGETDASMGYLVAATSRKQKVSSEYICFRCSESGHLIKDCPTNGDPAYDRKFAKKSTGIPRSQLVTVADATISGAMENIDGTFSVYRTSAEGESAYLLCSLLSTLPA